MDRHKSWSTDNKVYMKVLGVRVDDIHNWSPPPTLCGRHQEVTTEQDDNSQAVAMEAVPASKPLVSTDDMVGRRTEKGYLVSVNDELIALFKVQGKLFALKDSCPHAGGPLSMGDIEDLPGEGLSVRCPWHQWKILLETGHVGEHKGRKQSAVTYPVRVNSEGEIYIGFDQVSQAFFNIDKHPSVDIVKKREWKKSLTM